MGTFLRKLGTFLLLLIGAPVALALGLVVLVLAVLILPTRNFVIDKGLAYANENGLLAGYQVEIDTVDRLDPFGLNVRGVAVRDALGRDFVQVKWVLVRLNPYALLGSTLKLTKVRVDDARVQLHPAPMGPPEPEEPDTGGASTFTIRADDVRVRAVALDMELAGRPVHAVVGTLAASGQYGPHMALGLKELTARATSGREQLLRVRTTEGSWSDEKGGRVGLEAQIVDAHLTARADLPPLNESAPWPVRTASVRLRNLTNKTLTLAGVPDGGGLAVPVGLSLDAESKADALDAKLVLRPGKDRIDVHVHSDREEHVVDVGIAPLQLASVATMLPMMTVAGNLRVRATPSQPLGSVPEKVVLTWKNLAIDGGAVPSGTVRVALPLPVVRLEGLTLAGLEEALSARGEYDTERGNGKGALSFKQFRLEAIPWLQQLGLAGLLEGALAASYTNGALDGEGKLAIRDFKHPSASIQDLDLAFVLDGTVLAPHGTFQLRANALTVGELVIDQLSTEARATPEKLDGRLQVRGPHTLLNAELGGERTAAGDLRVQAIGRGTLQKRDVRFDLRELLYGAGGITVQQLALYSGKQSLRLSGNLDAQSRVKADLILRAVDLGEWAKVANVEGVTGLLGGTVNVGGTTSEPKVVANIDLRNARYKAKMPLNAKLALNGDLGTRKAELNFDMYSDEELGAKISAKVAIPKRPEALGDAIMRAALEADVTAWMPIEQISAIAGDQLAGLGGNLEAHIKARGTLDDPLLDADITAAMKLPEEEGEPVEAARVTAKVDKSMAKLDVWTKDELGDLLTMNGEVAWPGGNPRAALEHPAAWKDAKFRVRTELNSRRLDDMQGVFAYFTKLYALSLPIRVAGGLTFEGENAKLGGSARLALTVYGDKLDGRCRLGAESAVDMDAKLERDQVVVEIGARTDGGGTITGKLSSRLALNALNGGELEYGPAKLTVQGKQIDIHKLPGLCNLEGGTASFDAAAEGLGKGPPTLALNAKVDDLRAHEMQPLGIDLKARVGGREASLSTQIASQGRNIGAIDARVPLTYPDGKTPTVLPDAKLDGRVRFDKLPLANVLAFTQALGRTSGTATADIRLSGSVDNPYPAGFVQLEDVNMSIAALAQPLRDIDGRVEIKGRSVKIPKLTVRDRDGKITLEGFANLRDDFSGTGGIYLEADKFPLRQQGTVIGELTTRARLDVKIPQTLKADAQLKILDGSMWLTGERGKSVQTLDPHPDVRFADEKVGREETEGEAKAAGQGFGLGSFTMKTERELWLNHKDFAIQVGVDLALAQGEDGPTLEGEATLVRGDLQLLGKPFKLERGAIRFAGPMPPDPELDIRAKYDPPRGTDLVVQVSGRGSAPVLEFSGAATNAGEALLVLQGRAPGSGTGGQGAESQAANSMAGIAADMTAGLLIMTARREFGDWVPMISVDTGQSGGPASARAGFDASKLIPPWLAGFARSAYVEGIVGQSSGSGGRGVGVGVRLEVALPRDFITSFGYGPNPGGWSTDVAWSP